MSKPARLEKKDLIIIELSPSIIMTGAILILIMLGLSIGFNDNYYYLLGGI